MEKLCSVCNAKIDTEKAAILTMGGFGNPRYICEECEKELDILTKGKTHEDIKNAAEKLSGKICANNIEDSLVMETIDSIFAEAKIRAEQIKNGEYDFENDNIDCTDGASDDIPEELLESEEDKQLDRIESEMAQENEKRMKIVDLIFGIVFGSAVLAYIVYLFVDRFL